MIRCEGCDSLHLIADNLGWFSDEKSNIETIMKEKGSEVRKFLTDESLEFLIEDEIVADAQADIP